MQRGPPRPRPSSAPHDGDDLDALLAEVGVGGDVALVADDDSGREREEVAAVVPLFALGARHVLRRGEHPHLVEVEGLGERGRQVGVGGDVEAGRVGVTGPQGPRAQGVGEARVDGEGVAVEHGQHGVEVHVRTGGGELDGDQPGDRAVGEEPPGQVLHGLGGGPLPHADHDGAVAEDVHVAAFERPHGAVEDRLGRDGGEHRMEPVDGLGVQALAPPGVLGHRVDRQPVVHPAGVVAREEVVGQWGEREGVGVERVPDQAVRGGERQVALEHAADQVAGEGLAVQLGAARAHRIQQGGADTRAGDDPVQEPVTGLRDVEGLGQQVGEVVHTGSVVAQDLGEGVVLLAGPLGPEDVVEEQGVDVARGQPGEFEAGAVQDHLAEAADLGVDVEGVHGVAAPVVVRMPGGGVVRSVLVVEGALPEAAGSARGQASGQSLGRQDGLRGPHLSGRGREPHAAGLAVLPAVTLQPHVHR